MLALAQAVSLFGLRALGLCLGFLSTVIFARNTTTTTFGDFALLTSYISLLAIPTTFGLPEYLLRRFSQIKPNEIESEVHKSINSVCISFALIVGITFFI